MIRLLPGDCRDALATLPADSVQCVVTSPPYYGLRDYGTAQWDGGDAACNHARQSFTQGGTIAYRATCGKCGAVRVDRQIGLEATPDEYLATMVAVFREVRRVLRPDGTCWVNMGDSYAGNTESNGRSHNVSAGASGNRAGAGERKQGIRVGAKPKDLLMMPARLALALQADGWWLRSDIIWHKPNPMPESVTDRPTSAHEHVFLLTKAARYFYDATAVREEALSGSTSPFRSGAAYVNQGTAPCNSTHSGVVTRGQMDSTSRNLRNVWTISTQGFPDSHFATFPIALAERCIRAGTKCGDTVLDPFAGAGTTLLVADRLQRDAIGIELNTAYTEMAMQRCRDDAPLFADMPPAADPEDERMADLFAEAAE